MRFDDDWNRIGKGAIGDLVIKGSNFEEIRKCYNTGAFRSAIGMCGRILELILAVIYFKEKRCRPHWARVEYRNPDSKMLWRWGVKWTSLGDIFNLINKSRIISVHRTRRLYRPDQDDTKAITEFTIGLVKKLFQPIEQ